MALIESDNSELSQRESQDLDSAHHDDGEIQFLFMGLQTYAKALEWQAIFLKEMREGLRGPTILGLEHPPTITLGRRAVAETDLLWSQESRERHLMQVVQSPRGGQTTLHTPGQLVIYPLLRLTQYQLSVKDLLCRLTQSTQNTLASLGISASCPNPDEPGLFTEQGKIASFGLRIEQGFSSHGLAINNSNELHLFGSIRACGVMGQKHSRVLDESGPIEQKELFDLWTKHFLELFRLTEKH